MSVKLSDLPPLVALAQDAGEAILEVYARGASAAGVEWKEDRTPLTQADRAGHEVIVEGLRSRYPEIPVISEEDGSTAGSRPDPASGDPHWLVDPLDGTKEFIKRTGEFTVNIALVEKGRPVAGVVHAPALGSHWTGAEDGAERWDEDGYRTPLGTRTADPSSLGVVASRDHAGPQVQALLRILPDARTLSMGSSLKFCLIAEGRADLYLRDGPTMEWDTGAAQAVLEAAGGSVFGLEGERLAYGKKELRNPPFVAVGDPAFDWRTPLAQALEAAEGG